MSNRAKGLEVTLLRALPHIYYIICTWHLESNIIDHYKPELVLKEVIRMWQGTYNMPTKLEFNMQI